MGIRLLRLMFVAIIGVTLSQCTKFDKCESVTCQNGGRCNDGVCKCSEFYFGSHCDLETRINYYGTYKGTYTDSEGTITSYSLEILPFGTNEKKLEIKDAVFGRKGEIKKRVEVTLVSSDSFIVESLDYSNEFSLSGFGTFVDGSIHITLFAFNRLTYEEWTVQYIGKR